MISAGENIRRVGPRHFELGVSFGAMPTEDAYSPRLLQAEGRYHVAPYNRNPLDVFALADIEYTPDMPEYQPWRMSSAMALMAGTGVRFKIISYRNQGRRDKFYLEFSTRLGPVLREGPDTWQVRADLALGVTAGMWAVDFVRAGYNVLRNGEDTLLPPYSKLGVWSVGARLRF